MRKLRYASGRVEELGFGDPGYNVTAYEINNVRILKGMGCGKYFVCVLGNPNV